MHDYNLAPTYIEINLMLERNYDEKSFQINCRLTRIPIKNQDKYSFWGQIEYQSKEDCEVDKWTT